VRALLVHFFQPDCNACVEEMKALNALHGEIGRDVAILGIAHRRGPEEVREVARKLELSYPLLLGQESEVASAFARGDATVIAVSRGVVRYTQLGFEGGDEVRYEQVVRRLLGG